MKFTIPLQTAVAAYIREKKGWPPQFCDYYANRFWNFYQSNGWKVSGRAPMKDWKAAFNSQWQTLKFKEDLEEFKKYDPQPVGSMKPEDKEVNYLNERLADYARHPTAFSTESLQGLYDYLKEKKLMKLNTKQVEIARSAGPEKGKGLAVKMFFENLINSGKDFNQLMRK